jgi:NADH:ubiquinone oxidoreductase subunit E
MGNETNTTKEPLHICMGSACHQMGGYQVLAALEMLLEKYHLEDKVELKGAFCLEVCARGIVLKFKDELLFDYHIDNVEEKFINEILPRISKG